MRLSMIGTTKIFRFSKRQLHNDDHWNHISYITSQIKTSSLLFTRLKYVKNYLLCQKSLFLCLICHVHHVWNRNKKQIFKDIFKINFHVATNNPSLFRLRVGIQYYGFNRITLPVNTFGTLSHTTRGTPCHNANNGNLEPSKAYVYTT